MHQNNGLKRLLLGLFLPGLILAQTPGAQTTLNEQTEAMLEEGKYTAAVLDFEARGISQMEAQTLTDRMSGELVNTNAIILVERSQMDEILQEQGFQQTGCTTAECAAEVGALLGVQRMISGSFGKIGNTYTIEAKMFSVETGQSIKAVNKTYKGEVDGLLTMIELVAWDLMGLQPPADLLAKAGQAAPVAAAPVEEAKQEKKRGGGKWLRNLVVLAALGGGGYYAYSEGYLDELLGLGPKSLPGPPTLPE